MFLFFRFPLRQPQISDDEFKAFTDAKAERDKIKTELEALKKTTTPPPAPEPKKKEETTPPPKETDLLDKTRQGAVTAEQQKAQSKILEQAIKFNLGVDEFVKAHATILPSDVAQILKTAEKETYDGAVERAGAIKSAIVQSFFQVQANVDLLTASQKESLADYLKLTKSAKEEKAAEVFLHLFEPTIEMAKRIRKAEEVGKARGGQVTGNGFQEDYKKRLVAGSQKAHLGAVKGEKTA